MWFVVDVSGWMRVCCGSFLNLIVGGRKMDLIIPVVLLEDGEFSENAGTQIQIYVIAMVLWLLIKLRI